MPLKKIKTTFEAKDRSSGAISKLSSQVGKLQGRLNKLKNTKFTNLLSNFTGLSTVTKSLAGVGAGLALGALVTQGLAAGDAIAKTSDKLGIATEKLSELQFAVTQNTTVGIPQFNVALQRMVRRLGNANGETDAFTKRLEAFGLNVKELKQLAPEEQFKAIADRMAELGNQQERVALAFTIFDTEGANLVNLLQQGGDAIDQFTAKASRLGLGFEKGELDKIQAANDAIGRIQDVIRGLAISFAIELAPLIEGLADNITSFVERSGGVQVIIKNILDTAYGGFLAVKSVGETLAPIFQLLSIPLGAILKALSLVASGIQKVLNFFTRTGKEARAAAAEIDNLQSVAEKLEKGGSVSANDNIDLESLKERREISREAISLLDKELDALEEQENTRGRLGILQASRLKSKQKEFEAEGRILKQLNQVILAEEERLENAENISVTPEINIPEVKIPGLGDILGNQLSNALSGSLGDNLPKGESEEDKLKRQRDANLAKLKLLQESVDEELKIRNDFADKIKQLDDIETSGIAVVNRELLEQRFAEERDIALQAIEDRKEEELQREIDAENRKTQELLRIERERQALFGSTAEDINLNLPDVSANDNDFANQINDTSDREVQLQEQLDARIQRLRTAKEQELIIEEELNSQILAAKAQHQGQIELLEQFSAAKQQENAKKSLLSGLATFSQFSKKAFELHKAARLTEALISGRQAVMDAWKAGMSVGGPFAPAVAAAYATAAGVNALAQIRAIRETKFGASGGSVSNVGSGSAPSASTGSSSGSGSGGINSALNQDQSQANSGPTQRFEFYLSGNRRYDAEEIEQIIEGVNERVGAGITLRATVADEAEFAQNVA